MLGLPQLLDALLQIQPIPYPERNVFRCVDLAALIGDGSQPIQPLYDLGPRQSGQRYTPIGSHRALYVSESQHTSYVEATGMFNNVAAQAHQTNPAQAVLQFRVSLGATLDLTLEPNQQALATNRTELTASWRWQMAMGRPVPTQILGDTAFRSGRFQAIRFPSAQRADEVNLVIWTKRIIEPFFVESTDPRFYQRIPEQ